MPDFLADHTLQEFKNLMRTALCNYRRRNDELNERVGDIGKRLARVEAKRLNQTDELARLEAENLQLAEQVDKLCWELNSMTQNYEHVKEDVSKSIAGFVDAHKAVRQGNFAHADKQLCASIEYMRHYRN